MTADDTAAGRRQKKTKPPREYSPEELENRQLVALCKAGKLFEIQQWIAAGRRLSPPPYHGKGPRPESALGIAMHLGFHSLVEVLLKGGAAADDDCWGEAMQTALAMRRFDLVQLLVDQGFDPRSVDMDSVFHTWDPNIIEYFIDRGGDVETGGPLTNALRSRIRPALRILKQYEDRFPHFRQQKNAALRYHCEQGNVKWVALLLWAGADPYSRGSTRYCCDENDEDGEGWCALDYAVIGRHFNLFRLRGFLRDKGHPALKSVIGSAVWKEEGFELAQRLLRMGVDPNDQLNGGCSEIRSLISGMSWGLSYSSWGDQDRKRRNIDDESAREKMRALHFLVKHGARWRPTCDQGIAEVRRSLMKMTPDYTLEFVWIMSKFRACEKEAIVELVRTPSMKAHLRRHDARLKQLLARWDAPSTAECGGSEPRTDLAAVSQK